MLSGTTESRGRCWYGCERSKRHSGYPKKDDARQIGGRHLFCPLRHGNRDISLQLAYLILPFTEQAGPLGMGLFESRQWRHLTIVDFGQALCKLD